MDRQARLRLLLRKNAGRRRLPEMLGELSAAWGYAVPAADVLPLEETDRLRAAALPHIREAIRRAAPPDFSAWAPATALLLGRGLAALGQQLAGATLYYLPFYWEEAGAVRIAAGVTFPRAVALAGGRTEEFAACTGDGAAGLLLMYQAVDAEHGAPCPYELVLWGAAWLALAREAVPFESACAV
jgi:hypothetical protein